MVEKSDDIFTTSTQYRRVTDRETDIYCLIIVCAIIARSKRIHIVTEKLKRYSQTSMEVTMEGK